MANERQGQIRLKRRADRRDHCVKETREFSGRASHDDCSRCIPAAGFGPAFDGGIWRYAGVAFISSL